MTWEDSGGRRRWSCETAAAGQGNYWQVVAATRGGRVDDVEAGEDSLARLGRQSTRASRGGGRRDGVTVQISGLTMWQYGGSSDDESRQSTSNGGSPNGIRS